MSCCEPPCWMRSELRVIRRKERRKLLSPRSIERERARVMDMCFEHQMQSPLSRSPLKRVRVSGKRHQKIIDRLHSHGAVRKLSFGDLNSKKDKNVEKNGRKRKALAAKGSKEESEGATENSERVKSSLSNLFEGQGRKPVWRPASRLKAYSPSMDRAVYGTTLPRPKSSSYSLRKSRKGLHKATTVSSSMAHLSTRKATHPFFRSTTNTNYSVTGSESPALSTSSSVSILGDGDNFYDPLAMSASHAFISSKLIRRGEDPSMLYHGDMTPSWHALLRFKRQEQRLSTLESTTGTGPRVRSPWLVAKTQKSFGERLGVHCKDLKIETMKIPKLELEDTEFRY